MDLTPVIFQEIMLDVPMRVVKDGATLKTEGNGWKVLNEEEEHEDEDYIDPRLAKLKDYFKDKEWRGVPKGSTTKKSFKNKKKQKKNT